MISELPSACIHSHLWVTSLKKRTSTHIVIKKADTLIMKDLNPVKITRDKHLDHLVRVVPVLVVCYAIQCFFILNMGPDLITTLGLSVVGGLLAAMIMGFISYDVKHEVSLSESELKVKFFYYSQTISYEDILSVEVKNPGQNFSTLIIETSKGKIKFYFVDDAEKIKNFIEDKKHNDQMAA